MKPRTKVLISGAGIAGPTLAYWLHKQGCVVTLVEKAPHLRLGGQNIDISDAGIEIVQMMGIEPLIKARNTTEQGLLFVNGKGRVQARFPKGSETSFTSQYEILRGDLTEILYDLTKDLVTYKFAEEITELHQLDDGVRVHFRSGSPEHYDLFVGADGVGSKTRGLIFGSATFYKYLGIWTSYVTIPKLDRETKWARWYNATDARVILLRPDPKGTARASVNFKSKNSKESSVPKGEAAGILKKVLSGAGWEAQRIADHLDQDPDLYLGPVSQIHMPSWSKGCCVFVGDAAYCPTPITGMGTTLAIIGAFVLAGELSKTSDIQKAFQNYEKVLRPFVEKTQKLPPGIPGIAYPRTKLGIFILNRTASLIGSTSAQKIIGWMRGPAKEKPNEFQLPSYPL